MAASLRPAVRGATGKHLRGVLALHGAGLIVGALLMALVLALLGSALTATRLMWIPIVLAGTALALAALQIAGFGLPQSRWQVPEYWRRTLDAGMLPVAYGAILGLGIFTAVTVAAFWVFLVITLRFPAPVALAGWAAYAIGRLIGFGLALQVRPLERIFLTHVQEKVLVIATAIFAALVAIVS